MSHSAFRLAAMAAFSAAAFTTSAQAATVLDVTQYNGVFLGDFNGQNSDIEGALAAGGNVTLQNYGVGDRLNSTRNGTPTLVVGGDLKAQNGQLFYGDAQVSGSTSGVNNFNIRSGSLSQGISFDFTETFNALTQTSQSLSHYSANATAFIQHSSMTLTGTETGLNVFRLDTSDLTGIYSFNINVPTNSQVLINFAGAEAGFQNMGFSLTGVSANNILFNFADATSLTLGGIGFQGSILAPKASITFNNGQLNGLLIGKSFSGSGELHNTGYTGGLLTPPPRVTPAVPEPATWALMLLGFGVIGSAMRNRRRFISHAVA